MGTLLRLQSFTQIVLSLEINSNRVLNFERATGNSKQELLVVGGLSNFQPQAPLDVSIEGIKTSIESCWTFKGPFWGPKMLPLVHAAWMLGLCIFLPTNGFSIKLLKVKL